VLINPGDIADGVLVNALWAVAQMVVRPRPSRRTAAELDIAGWLTDAPAADASLAREAVRLALCSAPHAGQVSDYFDVKICALWSHIGRAGARHAGRVRKSHGERRDRYFRRALGVVPG
jgi:hypothetical protein